MKVLENLQPASVFKYFEEITQIPHGSKNVEKISNYLVDFAKEHNLKYIQDESKNVIIFKDASEGYENADTDTWIWLRLKKLIATKTWKKKA